MINYRKEFPDKVFKVKNGDNEKFYTIKDISSSWKDEIIYEKFSKGIWYFVTNVYLINNISITNNQDTLKFETWFEEIIHRVPDKTVVGMIPKTITLGELKKKINGINNS